MRRYLLPLALLPLAIASVPLQAQDAPELGDVVFQRRAAAIDDHIAIAVKEHKMTRRKAAALHTRVGRLQATAGNLQSRGGHIGHGDLARLNQQLSDLEVVVPRP